MSSWAFSATGALEGQYYKKRRYLTTLSEQQLLDCSEDYGNRGCDGGLASKAFLYVQSAGGICKESTYPYLGYVSVDDNLNIFITIIVGTWSMAVIL